MPSLKYLNTVLTVLTILLAVQLWTTWTGNGNGLVSAAQAQMGPAGAAGINPEAQRKEMIDLLKLLVQKTEEQTQLLKSGEVRVKLETPPADGK